MLTRLSAAVLALGGGLAIGLADLDTDIDIDVATARVTASSGVALPVLARKTASAGLSGFEWAVGVPDSIGGAVRMNAGGHGSDMAASLVEVTVFDLVDGVDHLIEVGLADRGVVAGGELQPAGSDVALDQVIQAP